MDQFLDMLQKSSIKRDEESEYKSIKIPQFSDGTEWEAVVFEMEVNLEKIWKYEHEMVSVSERTVQGSKPKAENT